MNYDYSSLKKNLDKSIGVLKDNFSKVRAGRANPSMLDRINVNYYDVSTPLNQLALISVPEARQLLIKPYDKSCLSDIEKAIYEADLGLVPNNDGETIRIIIPSLTEERRKELSKQIKVLAEDAKISIRNIRQNEINNVRKEDFSEDQEKKIINNIQKMIDEYNELVVSEMEEKQSEVEKV